MGADISEEDLVFLEAYGDAVEEETNNDDYRGEE